ncbi:MAG TPA: AMIN domain-containing protein, partial [Myxococcota bacterium]
LLPPASLPRSMGEAISLPPLTFTAVPRAATSVPTLVPQPSSSSPVSSLSPTEANLSPESRVFAGVPPTPRAVSMLPRVRTTPPTGSRSMLPTLAVTHAPTPALTDPPKPQQPSTSPPTQKLHSLPPVEVDVFAGWTFARVEMQPRVAANESVDLPRDDEAATLPPTTASDAASLLFAGDDDADRSPIVEETSHEDTPTMPPIDAAVAHALQERLRTEHASFDAAEAADTLIPSIVEERPVDDASLPPSTTDAFFGSQVMSTPPKSLDDSWANSLGPITAPHDALDVSATEQFRLRRPVVDEPRPSRQPHRVSSSSSKRRPLQLAAVVLAAGCAAGAAVGVLHRASQRPATKAPVVAAAAVAEARVERVLPVAEAEAELFGRPAKAAPTAVAAEVAAVEMPAAVAVAAAPIEPAVVEPSQVEAPVEVAKVEAPVEAAKVDAKLDAKIDAKPIEAATPETRVAKAEKPTKQKALVATPGRLEVDLPAGGRVKKVFALAGPSRVVVDLESASLPKDTVDVGAGGTQQLRFGKPEAGTQRVVLVLDGEGKPDAVDARLQGDRLIATWQR